MNLTTALNRVPGSVVGRRADLVDSALARVQAHLARHRRRRRLPAPLRSLIGPGGRGRPLRGRRSRPQRDAGWQFNSIKIGRVMFWVTF